MVGLELPVLAMEHHYLITEDMPEVAGDARRRSCRTSSTSPARSTSARSGRACCSAPTSRRACRGRRRTTPWDFGQDLLPHDLDRIAPSVDGRVQALPGDRDAPASRRSSTARSRSRPTATRWSARSGACATSGCACGVMAGFARAAASGLSLANWMVERRPGRRHLGAWTSPATATTPRSVHQRQGARELLAAASASRFPNEELPAARPLLTTPIYDRLQAEQRRVRRLLHARAPAVVRAEGHAARRKTRPSAARMPIRHVAEECRAVREACGLIEISNYAKYEVTGPGAAAWLSRLLACKDAGRRTHRAVARCSTNAAG